jgi:guanylate kinase
MTNTHAPDPSADAIASSQAGGSLFIVAAPSGAGKTSLVGALLAERPHIRLSVSMTTRAARPGEIDGQNYHFVTKPAFEAAVQNAQLLEWAHVHDNWYGTSRSWVQTQLDQGHDVLLEIDWQGAQQVRRMMPRAVGIFILPPSLDALSARLVARGQDSAQVIARRLQNAQEELLHVHEFEYTLINQDFSRTLEEFKAIVDVARFRTVEQHQRFATLFSQLGSQRLTTE